MGRPAKFDREMAVEVAMNEFWRRGVAASSAKALALQNLLVGLSLMSKVVRSEEDLWATAELTLKGLGLYRDDG